MYFNTLIIRDSNKSEDNNSPSSFVIIWPWFELFSAVSAKMYCEGFLWKSTNNWGDISVPVSHNLEVSLERIEPVRLLTLPTRRSSELHQRLSCKKFQLSFHKYGWNKVYIYPINSSIHSRMTEISDLFMVFLSKNLSFGKAEGEKFHFWTCAYSFPRENRTNSVLCKNWISQSEYFGQLLDIASNFCSKLVIWLLMDHIWIRGWQ